MSLPPSRLRTALVLAAYLAANWLALFGHVHHHGPGAMGDTCVTHAHRPHCHAGHDHHHEHDHDHAHAASHSAPEESIPRRAPVHDDDCAACQYQFCAVANLDCPPQLVQPLCVVAARHDESLAVPSLALSALRSRGPPVRC